MEMSLELQCSNTFFLTGITLMIWRPRVVSVMPTVVAVVVVVFLPPQLLQESSELHLAVNSLKEGTVYPALSSKEKRTPQLTET